MGAKRNLELKINIILFEEHLNAKQKLNHSCLPSLNVHNYFTEKLLSNLHGKVN